MRGVSTGCPPLPLQVKASRWFRRRPTLPAQLHIALARSGADADRPNTDPTSNDWKTAGKGGEIAETRSQVLSRSRRPATRSHSDAKAAVIAFTREVFIEISLVSSMRMNASRFPRSRRRGDDLRNTDLLSSRQRSFKISPRARSSRWGRLRQPEGELCASLSGNSVLFEQMLFNVLDNATLRLLIFGEEIANE